MFRRVDGVFSSTEINYTPSHQVTPTPVWEQVHVCTQLRMHTLTLAMAATIKAWHRQLILCNSLVFYLPGYCSGQAKKSKRSEIK
jgi:hypothetical protein